MAPKDLLCALVVVLAWGMNFVVIRLGLHGLPPMLLGALRMTLAAFPAVLVVKRPRVALRWLLAYGATISLGQFAFLFLAMAVGMPAGLASLVLQAQAFFTMLLAALFLRERIAAHGVMGLIIAAPGLAVIAWEGEQATRASLPAMQAMSVAGFALTLCAALMWALGNIVTKKVGNVDRVGLVVWGSLVPPLPFLALSYLMDGPQRMAAALTHLDYRSILAVVYLAFIATLLAYSLWSRLLSRYPAAVIAPFTLLVPVIGLAAAALLTGEHVSARQAWGIALVMGGLIINVCGARVRQGFAAMRSTQALPLTLCDSLPAADLPRDSV